MTNPINAPIQTAATAGTAADNVAHVGDRYGYLKKEAEQSWTYKIKDRSRSENLILLNRRLWKTCVEVRWKKGDEVTITRDALADRGFSLLTNNTRNEQCYASPCDALAPWVRGEIRRIHEKTR